MSKSRFVGAIIIISYSPTLPKDHQKQSKCRSMIPRLGGSPHLKRVHIDGPSLVAKPAELKRLGGSCSDIWNSHIANQAIDTLRSPKSDNGEATTETKATIVGLAGINPRDEIEGHARGATYRWTQRRDGVLSASRLAEYRQRASQLVSQFSRAPSQCSSTRSIAIEAKGNRRSP